MKNSFWLGIALGVLAPFLAFLCTEYTDWRVFLGGKALVFYVLAAAVNLFLLRLLYKKGQDKTGNGIIMITFVAVLILIFTNNIQI